jgi:uncharacterized coiled-coil DUF342 family protein
MIRTLTGIILAIVFTFGAAAQDWYHDRDARFRGDRDRHQVFLQVREDLEHIWSARHAADRERERIDRTKQQLTELQAKLDRGQWDNGMVNDVIDSLRKSANDDRLSPRDRRVLAEDADRIHDFQAMRNSRHR